MIYILVGLALLLLMGLFAIVELNSQFGSKILDLKESTEMLFSELRNTKLELSCLKKLPEIKEYSKIIKATSYYMSEGDVYFSDPNFIVARISLEYLPLELARAKKLLEDNCPKKCTKKK